MIPERPKVKSYEGNILERLQEFVADGTVQEDDIIEKVSLDFEKCEFLEIFASIDFEELGVN